MRLFIRGRIWFEFTKKIICYYKKFYMHLSISAFLASNSARVINPSSYIFFKASILDTPLTFSPASASTSGTDWAQPIFSYSVDTSLFMRVAFTPQTILRPVTSGTSATFGKTTTKKIGFYFFTYEWSRRRLSLIKMINGVEEVLILLFTAFEYEYLF